MLAQKVPDEDLASSKPRKYLRKLRSLIVNFLSRADFSRLNKVNIVTSDESIINMDK